MTDVNRRVRNTLLTKLTQVMRVKKHRLDQQNFNKQQKFANRSKEFENGKIKATFYHSIH